MKASTIVRAIEAVNKLKELGYPIYVREENIAFSPADGYFNIPYTEIESVEETGLTIEFKCRHFTVAFWLHVTRWHITHYYNIELI